MNLLLEEMNQDQNLPLSEEIVLKVSPRSSYQPLTSLQELHNRMEKEMKTDEKFYKRHPTPKRKPTNKVYEKQENKVPIKPDVRHFFIERARLAQRKPKLKQNRNFLQLTKDTKPMDLDLNSNEMRTILKSRAKAKAAKKNIIFTSAELDELIGRASKKFTNSRRFKRDINMRLLNRKTAAQDKRDRVLGNPLKIQADFNERMRRLTNQFKINNKRMKREINMELLKLKSKDKYQRDKKEE